MLIPQSYPASTSSRATKDSTDLLPNHDRPTGEVCPPQPRLGEDVSESSKVCATLVRFHLFENLAMGIKLRRVNEHYLERKGTCHIPSSLNLSLSQSLERRKSRCVPPLFHQPSRRFGGKPAHDQEWDGGYKRCCQLDPPSDTSHSVEDEVRAWAS